MPEATLTPATSRMLRLEAVAALVVAVVFYQLNGFSWLLFAVGFLIPDLSMLGYLRGARTGALAYNAVHTYSAPLLLGLASFATSASIGLAIANIWFAHIAFDRALGFGLKHATGFNSTHLGSIGRR